MDSIIIKGGEVPSLTKTSENLKWEEKSRLQNTLLDDRFSARLPSSQAGVGSPLLELSRDVLDGSGGSHF